MLVCGKHRCPDKCHQLVDHSKVLCLEKIDVQCSRKHQSQRQCWQQADRCPICERDANLLQKRKQKQDEYLAKLIAVEDQISLQRDIVQDLDDANVRATTLKQKSEELAKATRAAQLKINARIKKDTQSQKEAQTQNARADITRSGHSDTAPAVGAESQATKAWKVQKKEFLADNEHIDAIMGLIGLESVKRQVLAVKDKVDTSLRQGASLSKERFNVLLLGNPGTGQSTDTSLLVVLTRHREDHSCPIVREVSCFNGCGGWREGPREYSFQAYNCGCDWLQADSRRDLERGWWRFVH